MTRPRIPTSPVSDIGALRLLHRFELLDSLEREEDHRTGILELAADISGDATLQRKLSYQIHFQLWRALAEVEIRQIDHTILGRVVDSYT